MLNRFFKHFLSLFVCALALLPLPASAQYADFNQGFNQNIYPDISPHNWDKPDTSSSTDETPQPRTRHSTSLSSRIHLPYRRDMTLAEKLRMEFLANASKGSPTSSFPNLRAFSAKVDMVEFFAFMAKHEGLDTSTAEGLTALWYGQAWAIANQRPLPTARQYQGIAKQLRDTNANAMFWDKLDNKGRQTVVEMIAYPAVLQRFTYENYRAAGNTTGIASLAKRVQASMLKFKMNMQSLRLTDAGLE